MAVKKIKVLADEIDGVELAYSQEVALRTDNIEVLTDAVASDNLDDAIAELSTAKPLDKIFHEEMIIPLEKHIILHEPTFMEFFTLYGDMVII